MQEHIKQFKENVLASPSFLEFSIQSYELLGEKTFRGNRIQQLEDRGVDFLVAMAMVDTVIEIIQTKLKGL